jgi:hypothetical protein
MGFFGSGCFVGSTVPSGVTVACRAKRRVDREVELGVVIFGSLISATPLGCTTGPAFPAVNLALVWDLVVAKGGMESGEEPHRGRCGLSY